MVLLTRFHIRNFGSIQCFFLNKIKRVFIKCTTFFCYVLILSIHMNPQTSVNIFKHFTSKGEHLYLNEKEKGKNLFLCKIWNYEPLWKTPNYFFSMKRKEKKKGKKPACVTFEMMVFAKLPIISFVWKRKKRKKEKNLFRRKYKATMVLWKLSYSFCSVPFRTR